MFSPSRRCHCWHDTQCECPERGSAGLRATAAPSSRCCCAVSGARRTRRKAGERASPATPAYRLQQPSLARCPARDTHAQCAAEAGRRGAAGRADLTRNRYRLRTHVDARRGLAGPCWALLGLTEPCTPERPRAHRGSPAKGSTVYRKRSVPRVPRGSGPHRPAAAWPRTTTLSDRRHDETAVPNRPK